MAIPVGSGEILVHADEQPLFRATVAANGGGRILFAWEEPVPDDDPIEPTAYTDIFGRIFDGEVPLTGDFVVNAERADPQWEADIAVRTSGDFVVAYRSGVEDSLPGYFVATTIVSASGVPSSEELGDYSYYHYSPDVAAGTDDTFLVVSGEEFEGEGRLHNPDGSIATTFGFGYVSTDSGIGAASLGIDGYLLFWNGLAGEEDASVDPALPNGLYGEFVGPDGSEGTPFLIAETGVDAVDPIGVRTFDGSVALLWETPAGEILLSYVDAEVGTATAPVTIATGAVLPEVALLESGDMVVVYQSGDGSGAGIYGRVIADDGTVGDAFLVNEVTAGSQNSPSISANGNGFVVAWTGSDGVKARFFELADDGPVPLNAITSSSEAAETLAAKNAGGTDVFFFDTASGASLGNDRIRQFGAEDLLVTTSKIFDGNNDGIITFGGNRALDLGEDAITMRGTSGAAITTLEFDGVVTYRDVDFFVYSRVGSAAGTEDLVF